MASFITVINGIPTLQTESVSSSTHTWTSAHTATKTFTHNLGTTNVNVQVFDVATGATIEIDSIVRNDANNITVSASTDPPAGSWLVVVIAAN